MAKKAKKISQEKRNLAERLVKEAVSIVSSNRASLKDARRLAQIFKGLTVQQAEEVGQPSALWAWEAALLFQESAALAQTDPNRAMRARALGRAILSKTEIASGEVLSLSLIIDFGDRGDCQGRTVGKGRPLSKFAWPEEKKAGLSDIDCYCEFFKEQLFLQMALKNKISGRGYDKWFSLSVLIEEE